MAVSDDGPGIDEEDFEHVFERFYRGQAKGSRPGSGIGLAIAHQNLEVMDGDIGIGPGGGTTVTITVPVA